LKSTWPAEPGEAARRIAGHANAARGSPILWLIGVDERSGVVVGAERAELANWYPQVGSHFDGLAPAVTDLNIPTAEKLTVVALVFETDRSPYVVKASNDRLEVPWREGTRVRSATREDLLRLLWRLHRLPTLEQRRGSMTATFGGDAAGPFVEWTLEAWLYVYPEGEGYVVFPVHKCIIAARIGEALTLTFDPPRFVPGGIPSHLMATPHDLTVEGPGMVVLTASTKIPGTSAPFVAPAVADIRLMPAGGDVPAVITLVMNTVQNEGGRQYRWSD